MLITVRNIRFKRNKKKENQFVKQRCAACHIAITSLSLAREEQLCQVTPLPSARKPSSLYSIQKRQLKKSAAPTEPRSFNENLFD